MKRTARTTTRGSITSWPSGWQTSRSSDFVLRPAVPSASRSPAVHALLESVDELQRSADRLVGLWTTFRADRLALYRELGVLPYNDWSSFYAQFSAGPAGPQEAEPEPPGNAIAPPAIPRTSPPQ